MAYSNIEKEKIILCSFITKKQLGMLMDTTNYYTVKKAFEDCRNQILSEGKKLYHPDKIPKDRALKMLGISEKEIHKNASIERQIKKEMLLTESEKLEASKESVK